MSRPDAEPLAADADPTVLRAHFRLRVLEELTEAGLRLVRALERRVLAEEEAVPDKASPDEAAPEGASGAQAAKASADPAAAFASLSRAIRLTVALHGKTDEALRALESGAEERRAAAVERDRDATAKARDERQYRIEYLVLDAAKNEMRDGADWERLDHEFEKRLLVDEDFWNDPKRPVREIAELYCRYFGLSPDWNLWDGDGRAPPDEPPEPWPWVAGRAPAAAEAVPTLAAHALE